MNDPWFPVPYRPLQPASSALAAYGPTEIWWANLTVVPSDDKTITQHAARAMAPTPTSRQSADSGVEA